ncbi:hypothetical protein SAMN05421809_2053 [Natronorubrum daqingense]|uniref:Uncharacterized protein n=1 Tax=Natronorubrum daqingense TaxID=588898 RepID=A0A1N7D503_9EURY|nr:hypothetical protein SAMN05421809_2053 [Natronorubrum daqingense]
MIRSETPLLDGFGENAGDGVTIAHGQSARGERSKCSSEQLGGSKNGRSIHSLLSYHDTFR